MKKEFEDKDELLEMVKGKTILIWVAGLSYISVTKKSLISAMKDRKYIMGEVYIGEYSTAVVFR